MFTKKVNKNNDKEMFNFLKEHYTYDTMNSWNGCKSIANNVKVYNLDLKGDPYQALQYLQYDECTELNSYLYDWELEHKGYTLGFNGRSDGYLVLYNKNDSRNVLPDFIVDSQDYEDYKQYCKDYVGTVKENRFLLREYVELVQDFDKLCDELRNYMQRLSMVETNNYILENIVENFNWNYEDELNDSLLQYDADKKQVDISKLTKSLKYCFLDMLERVKNCGYSVNLNNDILKLEC